MILQKIRYYVELMRWHKPVPILLSLWPTYWGLFLGAKPSIKLLCVFTVGVVLMRAAGCVVNDLFDQKYDRFVGRTAERPLACGYVRNYEALILLFVLLLASCSLLLFLNPLAQFLSLPALVLALAYPLAKRFTYFPQLVLGMAFNFGMIMAYAAVNNELGHFIYALYGLSIIWTLYYDSIYSLMDYADDKRLRLKSPATYFDAKVYPFLLFLALVLLVSVSVLLHHLHLQDAFIFWLMFAFLLLRSCWQLLKMKLLFLLPLFLLRHQMKGMQVSVWDNPMLCPSWSESALYQKIFNQQHWLGFVVFLMIIARYAGF